MSTFQSPSLQQCMAEPSTKISPNFRFSEMVKSRTADGLGIDNASYVTEEIFQNMLRLCSNILEPVRDYAGKGFSPNSVFRSEMLEKAITWGGDNTNSSYARWCRKKSLAVNEQTWPKYYARKSHPKGNAADHEISGIDNLELFSWIRDNLEYDQLILEFYKENDPTSGWVHASYSSPETNRKQVFKIG